MTDASYISFSTVNEGWKQDNGMWKVVSTLLEKTRLEDGTEEHESIEAMCYDDNFVQAQQLALQSALIQYREEVLDKGFNSLIAARKTSNDDSPKVDTDTSTQ